MPSWIGRRSIFPSSVALCILPTSAAFAVSGGVSGSRPTPPSYVPLGRVAGTTGGTRTHDGDYTRPRLHVAKRIRSPFSDHWGKRLHGNTFLSMTSANVPSNKFVHSCDVKEGDGHTSYTRPKPRIDFRNVRLQCRTFREMAIPYYRESRAGRWLFVGLVGLTLLNSAVSVVFSYVGRYFWNALSSKNPRQFYGIMWRYAAALVVGAPVSVLHRFQRERLAVKWRKWMTDRTLQLYTSNRVYYALERGAEIDNPDQRIAEDVKSFTDFSLELFMTLATSLIDLVFFSVVLYSIQPRLFMAIIAYAVFGTWTTTALGRRLMGLNFERFQREADFRYSLIRVRDNAESIAFYGGEEVESKEISNRFTKVAENKQKINKAQRNLELFTTTYHYLIQILPVSVVAPQYFAGSIQLGIVSQSAGAFRHILNDLSVVVDEFEQLSTFSAGIDRLSQFMKAIKEADRERSRDSPLMELSNVSKEKITALANADNTTSFVRKGTAEIMLRQMTPQRDDLKLPAVPINGNSAVMPTILSIENLSLTTPDGKRLLIKDLNLTLREGENLIIVGNSGAGKSSLIRAIGGLWTAGAGVIERPSDDDVYFLPQRPYCPLGSLKEQLLYPGLEGAWSEDKSEKDHLICSYPIRQSLTDDDLLAVLDAVGLSELAIRAGDGDSIKGLSTVMDWSNILSLGEQQRLAFGRILLNQPRLVILDEATSALDMVSEAKMYNLLCEMGRKNFVKKGQPSQAGLTYISVGHRPSLLSYHEKRLRLYGEENQAVSDIEKPSVGNSSVVSNL